MPLGEVYTALERRVIDGYAMPNIGVTDYGLEELTAIQVLPTYNKIGIINFMNFDRYNDLPDDVKQLLTEAMIEVEEEVVGVSEELVTEESKKLQEAGVEPITIKEAEEYKQLASDASWEWMIENVENGKKVMVAVCFRLNVQQH